MSVPLAAPGSHSTSPIWSMCTKGSSAARSTPANARFTGKPSPSKPPGAWSCDVTRPLRRGGGVGFGHPRQHKDVVNGDGGHGSSSTVRSCRVGPFNTICARKYSEWCAGFRARRVGRSAASVDDGLEHHGSQLATDRVRVARQELRHEDGADVLDGIDPERRARRSAPCELAFTGQVLERGGVLDDREAEAEAGALHGRLREGGTGRPR